MNERPADRGYSANALETNRLANDVGAVRAALSAAQTGLVDREAIAEAVVLCAIAGEHLLVIGPPGTAKSEAVRRVAKVLGGSYFEYLIGRFTEPNELFGPIDLRRLREGVVEVETAGMLPEADVAFLDEVFLGSTAILNTLLGLLNERVFRRGRTAMPVGLRVCVGASNALPDDPALAAFADRFLGRVFIDSVADARLEELLEVGWAAGDGVPDTIAHLDAIDRLAAAARQVELEPMQPVIGQAIRRLRSAGIELSDRRAVRAQRLVAAAAVLDGRATARPTDLWVLPLVAPGPDDQAAAQDALGPLIEDAANATLIHAAEAFARGRRARATRLISVGRELLSGTAGEEQRLRIEAALREIDAGFSTTEMPEDLALVRAQLAEVLTRDDDRPAPA
jgi:MoxR-like ATPase